MAFEEGGVFDEVAEASWEKNSRRTAARETMVGSLDGSMLGCRNHNIDTKVESRTITVFAS